MNKSWCSEYFTEKIVHSSPGGRRDFSRFDPRPRRPHFSNFGLPAERTEEPFAKRSSSSSCRPFILSYQRQRSPKRVFGHGEKATGLVAAGSARAAVATLRRRGRRRCGGGGEGGGPAGGGRGEGGGQCRVSDEKGCKSDRHVVQGDARSVASDDL